MSRDTTWSGTCSCDQLSSTWPSAPESTVWTAVDRPVYVQVSLPASVDSAPVTVLSTQIGATLPYREPTPGG